MRYDSPEKRKIGVITSDCEEQNCTTKVERKKKKLNPDSSKSNSIQTTTDQHNQKSTSNLSQLKVLKKNQYLYAL